MLSKRSFKRILVLTILLMLGLGTFNFLVSQTARNPVLELCSGTW
jgi:hypothetical protein